MKPSHSLRRKLPLLISTLLVTVVTAMGWLAFGQIEKALVIATDLRIASVSQRLAELLDESASRVRRDLADRANDPAIARYLTSRSSLDSLSALAAIRRAPTRGAQPLEITVWSVNDQRILHVGSSFSANRSAPDRGRAVLSGRPPYAAWIGNLSRVDGFVAYEVTAPILATNGDTLGFIVSYGRSSSSGQSTSQISSLIGAHAAMSVGNADGSLWTNLSDTVAGPPLKLATDRGVQHLVSDGVAVDGSLSEIRGTPWVVWVQTPHAAVIAPAKAFLLRFAIIGFVIILFGTIAAWKLCDHVTRPLADITRAAEDVARGDYSRRVSIVRNDELGSLAQSFNSMAAQVEKANDELRSHADALEAANSELRAGEERLLSSERHFRALIEHASDMICVLGDDATLRYVSPTRTSFIGFSPTDLEGRSFFEFVHPDDQAAVYSAFDAVRQNAGATASIQYRHRHQDGSWRALAGVARNLLDDSSVRGIVLNSHDVSEEQALTAQLIQAQKMEAVGQLAGGIAHDFNNLLTVMTSYSGMLLEELPHDSPARSDIQEIRRAAVRAGELTKQLLAFSRQQVLQPKVLDLNEVVSDIQKMLGRLLRADVRLEMKLSPRLGRVHADRGQLEQVIMNLAVNARDAMPNGGTLTLSTSEVTMNEEYARMHADLAPGAYVMLAVTDTGCGMDAETMSRVFEPFFTTKDVGHGTGLGLSTVYGIVRQSGGHVTVHSEPRIGTTFEVYLPIHSHVDERRPVTGGFQSVHHGSGTVLLVEDEDQVRHVARRILERAGYTVLEASSGWEALALSSTHGAEIDLLLTDIVMPNMSGRELATIFRELRPNTGTAFMSGYTEDALMQRSVFDADTIFVEKPFTPEVLTRKVREALAGA